MRHSVSPKELPVLLGGGYHTPSQLKLVKWFYNIMQMMTYGKKMEDKEVFDSQE